MITGSEFWHGHAVLAAQGLYPCGVCKLGHGC